MRLQIQQQPGTAGCQHFELESTLICGSGKPIKPPRMKIIYLFTFLLGSFCLLSAQKNVGIGTAEPNARLHILGDTNTTLPALLSQVSYTGSADIPALYGVSSPADGWGYGGYFEGGYMGIRSFAYAGTYPGFAYGVYGTAEGTQGTRIGVYGSAYGGDENWAGYFDGKGKFTGPLNLDQTLTAAGNIEAGQNLFVEDTAFASAIHTYWSKPYLDLRANKDLKITIDRVADPSYTAVFRILNGSGGDVFGADENGNARTYGTHYIDGSVFTGQMPASGYPAIGTGNLAVLGTNGFQSAGDRGILYLGGVHNYIAAEYGYGVRIGTYAVGDALSIREINGDVLIGRPAFAAHASGYKLSVDGKIMSEELRVLDSGNWPDYVFREDYQLLPLELLEEAIRSEGHLPGIPSANEIEHEGILIGDMQKRMMAKIEELTLYILDLDKEIKQLKRENIELNKRLDQHKVTQE